MMRVAVIIPYFGHWPQWFDLYLYSCSKNPIVDFIFFTDCDIPSQVYDNIIFHEMSFKDYCKRVSDCLKINFYPKKTYKLCDLRPFFSIIHEKELVQYDFWGFADIDLVYGDLSLVVNSETLKSYNVISCHADRISGHFTIIRKSSAISLIGLKIDNWKRKLESQNHYGLDEVDLTKLIYPQLKNVLRIYRYIVNPLFKPNSHTYLNFVNHLIGMWTKKSFKEYYTSPIPKDNEVWRYYMDKGIVESPFKQELPYLHFLFFKKTPYLDTDIYWRENFWKVPNEINFDGKIIITNRAISYQK